MKVLRTEIEIQATFDTVWQILTDLERYAEWNPFITRAVGKADVGEQVEITVPDRSRTRLLHCTVTKALLNKELCWTYHVFLPGLFRGEHRFSLEAGEDDAVRLVDEEIFNGLAVFLDASEIDTHTRQGFHAMDRALKARAEAG